MKTDNQNSQEDQHNSNPEEAVKTSDTPSESPLQKDVKSILMNLLKGYTELTELTALVDYVDRTLEVRIKVIRNNKK